MNCQSCGMPMDQDVDHGGGRADNNYCKNCTDEAGNLKSREEVKEGMISFYMQSMGKSREEAEREVDAHMAQMPAWGQTNPAVSSAPMPATSPVDPIPETAAPVAPPVTTDENPIPQVSVESATPNPMPQAPVEPTPNPIIEPVVESPVVPPTTPIEQVPPAEAPVSSETPGQTPGSNQTE